MKKHLSGELCKNKLYPEAAAFLPGASAKCSEQRDSANVIQNKSQKQMKDSKGSKWKREGLNVHLDELHTGEDCTLIGNDEQTEENKRKACISTATMPTSTNR